MADFGLHVAFDYNIRMNESRDLCLDKAHWLHYWRLDFTSQIMAAYGVARLWQKEVDLRWFCSEFDCELTDHCYVSSARFNLPNTDYLCLPVDYCGETMDLYFVSC